VPPKDALLDLVGDAHFVLIGEASHGTDEFSAARAGMTQRLIEEKGFCAVAAEADWPDAYRVNRFVRGRSADTTAEEALRGFERFPAWMWRNTVVLDFVGWLRERNDRARGEASGKAGFYGLDLYSLYRSMHEVVSYLERVDPAAAARARERYSCFDHYNSTTTRETTARPTGLPPRSVPANPASRRWWTSLSTCSVTRRNMCTGMGCWPRTSCSTPSRTRRR
jgi:erythromycin esterase-like protein